MWNRTYTLVLLFMVIIIILLSVRYKNYPMNTLTLLFTNQNLTIHQTTINTTTTTTTTTITTTKTKAATIPPRFSKDPEAKICYSLRSLSMPEEMINFNAIVAFRQPIPAAKAPAQVTYNQVHTLLYGDPSTKSIYNNARKYFNKKYDRSYPHTYLKADTFTTITKRVDPSVKIQFVVEVGSFTGNSASVIGNFLKNAYPGVFMLCIDTWLGDLNMWVNKVVWNHLSVTEDGRPTVYYQFLANMLEQNLNGTVLPASMSSVIGARFLETFQLHPQLIYLDSAHEQGETLIELALYWNLLRPGGVLFGDDWGWLAVRCDVKKFIYMRNLPVEHIRNTWVLRKPL